jgi:hypothetical protein
MAVTCDNNAKTLRGTLIMIAGITLLFHTLGLIEQSLSFLLALAALSLIIYGFYISGLYHTVRGYLSKGREERREE